MVIRRALTLMLAVAGLMAGVLPAAAETDVVLARYKDWEVHKLTRDTGSTCYAISRPTRKAPKGVHRGDTYFIVTNWPARESTAEPSIVAGYPYRKGSDVTVTVGKTKFKFFTKEDGAWVAEPAEERRLIAQMRRGLSMVVRGTSSRGTLTTDHYSLKGSDAALDKIAEACK